MDNNSKDSKTFTSISLSINLPSDIWSCLIDWLASSYYNEWMREDNTEERNKESPLAISEKIWVFRSEALRSIKPVCKSALNGAYKFINIYLNEWFSIKPLESQYGDRDIIKGSLFTLTMCLYYYPDRLVSIPLYERICMDRIALAVTLNYNIFPRGKGWTYGIIFLKESQKELLNNNKIINLLNNDDDYEDGKKKCFYYTLSTSPPPYIIQSIVNIGPWGNNNRYDLTTTFTLNLSLVNEDQNGHLRVYFVNGKPEGIWKFRSDALGVETIIFKEGQVIAKLLDRRSITNPNNIISNEVYYYQGGNQDQEKDNKGIKYKRLTIDIYDIKGKEDDSIINSYLKDLLAGSNLL